MTRSSTTRVLAVAIGALLLVPVALALRALDVLSLWGWAEWALTGILAAGLVSLPWRASKRIGPTRVGLVGLAVVFSLRVALVGAPPGARLTTLPGDHGARWANRLFEERDAAILGARLLDDLGLMHRADEFPTLPGLLTVGYDRLDHEAPRLGTPILATYSGAQSAAAFDCFVVESAVDARPDEALGTVVFLHGYGGNFAFQCWEVAMAAREAGFRTLCPSTGSDGAWWRGDGEAIARSTIESARVGATTARPIILAGLSNGGVGASRLAPELRGSIDGLILLSGAAPYAPGPGVPTLVLHGERDSMMPVEVARDYRAVNPGRVTDYVELPGTHFIVLEQRDEVRGHIARFLRARL